MRGLNIGQFRVIDANLNRAREGLRVIEDRVRFELNDATRTRALRRLRHAVGGLADGMGMKLLAARDSAGDVDRAAPGGSADAATAGFKRVQEALRSLEACGVRGAARLRFRAYDLEKEIVPLLVRARRLDGAHVYVILEPRGWTRVVGCGADLFQLRAPGMSDRRLLRWARQVRRRTRARLIVNDRPDVAEAAGADGVHLGARDMPVAEARRLLRPDRLIGATTHTLAEARAAARAGADYISVGPMFTSRTKPGLKPGGFRYLRSALKLDVPAFAIGGIDLSNVRELRRAGVTRVAVCEAVGKASNPRRVVRGLGRVLRSRR